MAGPPINLQVYLQWSRLSLGQSRFFSLKAIVDLGLPDILAKAGRELTVFEIAQKLPSATVDVEYLYRLVMFAAFLGVFKVSSAPDSSIDGGTDTKGKVAAGDAEGLLMMRNKDLEQKRFGVTPLSMAMTDECSSNSQASLAHIVRYFSTKHTVLPFMDLAEAVLTGKQPIQIANDGVDIWESFRALPEWGALFNKAMAAFSINHMSFALQSYKGFEGIQVLVDVGGGLGACLEAIVRAYPGIKGINFDLPSVIAQAPEIPGVKHVGGDMFQSLPEGDAIFMKAILHDWTDEQCLKILQNCHKALPSSGKVILAETVLSPVDDMKPDDQFAYEQDLFMLARTSGRERTRVEFQRILTEAGFPRVEIVPTSLHVLSIIEGYKS